MFGSSGRKTGRKTVGQEMFLLFETLLWVVQLQSVYSGVVFMCGRSCARTLWRSSCEETPCLCGWALGCCCCGAGGCRWESGSAGWCRWAGRCAARAPPPTGTRDTAEREEREDLSFYFILAHTCADVKARGGEFAKGAKPPNKTFKLWECATTIRP